MARELFTKIYTRINWRNRSEAMTTALGATLLNRMDYTMDETDSRIAALDILKAEESEVLQMVKDWSMDEETGIITVTKKNGEKIMFDLNIEKIPVSFTLSSKGILTMTTDDGTKFTADIGSLIPVLTFKSSDTVSVTVEGTGINKTYSFSVKEGSIKDKHLQPSYLADIKVQAQAADKSAGNAQTEADRAKTEADRAKTEADRSKTEANRSKTEADKAQSIADRTTEEIKEAVKAELIKIFNKNVESWEAEFDAWLDTLKSQLGEDDAGNLQNEINSIKAVLREISESEIDEIIAGTYKGNEGGIEPDVYSRVTSEEIERAVNNAFGGGE